MKRFIQFFLSAYSNDLLEIRKKTRLLVIINLVLTAIVLLNIFFSELMISHDYLSAAVEGGMVAVLVLSLFLLRAGKFLVSANITLVLLSIAMFFLSVVTKDVTVGFMVIQIAFLQIPILIYTSLIGTHTYQTVLSGALALGFLAVYFVTLPFTSAGFNYSSQDVYQFIICVMVLSVSCVMAFLILKNSGELIAIAEKEVARNREKNKSIESVIRSSQEGMSVGEKLVEFASRTLELVNGINGNFGTIRKETDFLSAIIKSSQESNTAMLDSSRKVKLIIGEQNAAVNETSSSVEEITRSMNRISSTAKSRKEVIERLVQTAVESQKEMDQAVRSIQEISHSAEDMLGIIRVIQDVASQTNILAMNAAIEASHAGASGRGFAIVASEIRKLSVETDRNSKLITATLKKNIGGISNASAINVRAGQYFQKMSDEVTEVKNSIDEIILGMEEVSKGTGSILEAVTGILKMSGEVDQSMNAVDTRITDSNANIRNIADFTNELKQKIESMVRSFEDIVHITRLIEKAGKENTQNIEKLDSEIASIMK